MAVLPRLVRKGAPEDEEQFSEGESSEPKVIEFFADAEHTCPKGRESGPSGLSSPARKSITYKPSRKIRVTLKMARRSRLVERPVKGEAKKVKPIPKPRKGKPRARGR